uniref:TF-B3 domain-containing protein n=1 Tax=Salix viminalis TaxID=40686 RepID=A0A6N2M906_SALVM
MTKRLFDKTLSKTDVEYRMVIPMDSLPRFRIPEGEFSKKVDVFDNNCCRWSFRCSKRKNDPHPKPVLSAGWIKFVKEKGLKEGDQVIFSVSDRDGAEDFNDLVGDSTKADGELRVKIMIANVSRDSRHGGGQFRQLMRYGIQFVRNRILFMVQFFSAID